MKVINVSLMALGLAQFVAQGQLFSITNQPVSRTVWAGCTVSFSVGVTGGGPFGYQWQLDNTDLPSGIITTVAGTGVRGCSGDGGAALSANLCAPVGLVVDMAGRIVIADDCNLRIRTVDNSGTIKTIAGSGSSGFSGDGGPATNASLRSPHRVALDAQGNLYIADEINYCIRKVDTNGIVTTVAGKGGVSGGYFGGWRTRDECDDGWPD